MGTWILERHGKGDGNKAEARLVHALLEVESPPLLVDQHQKTREIGFRVATLNLNHGSRHDMGAALMPNILDQ